MQYLILSIFLTSCAFKHSEPPPALESAFNGITIVWETDRAYSVNRHLQESTDGYEAPTPVTFSSPVPETIYVSGAPALGENNYLESASADISGKAYALAASMKDGRIEIAGFKTLLPDDKDQALTLNLTARNGRSGSLIWTLKIHFLTLPTPIPVEPVAISNFETLRKFVSPALRLDLIKAVKIINTKSLPIRVGVPGKWLRGQMQRTFTNYILDKHECSTAAASTSRTDVYATSFSLMPLYEGLKNEWLMRAYEGGNSFEISPGEDLVLGLFGSGKELASFVDNGVPAFTAPEVTTPVSCSDESCSDPMPKDPRHFMCHIRHVEKARMKEGVEGGPVEVQLGDSVYNISYASNNDAEENLNRRIEVFPVISPL